MTVSNDSWRASPSNEITAAIAGSIPPLFSAFVDDAAVFPPGSASLSEAITGHARHRTAWYAPMIGPLVLPTSMVSSLASFAGATAGMEIGIVADTGIDRLSGAVAEANALGLRVRQVEAAVAKRGEDPQPGLARLLAVAAELADLDVFAEIPLTMGLHQALDRVTEARSGGTRVAAKFRTGGLASELFPTPGELAAVICACRDRSVPFKLTAGLHRAIRHNDPETGFTHHGFVNILAACLDAAAGADVAAVTERLASTDPIPLIETIRAHRTSARPLWTGFGSCSVAEPVADVRSLGLLGEVDEAVVSPA